ncbi:uncharacterized protein AAEQ78_014340 [Lycaon pictus]
MHRPPPPRASTRHREAAGVTRGSGSRAAGPRPSPLGSPGVDVATRLLAACPWERGARPPTRLLSLLQGCGPHRLPFALAVSCLFGYRRLGKRLSQDLRPDGVGPGRGARILGVTSGLGATARWRGSWGAAGRGAAGGGAAVGAAGGCSWRPQLEDTDGRGSWRPQLEGAAGGGSWGSSWGGQLEGIAGGQLEAAPGRRPRPFPSRGCELLPARPGRALAQGRGLPAQPPQTAPDRRAWGTEASTAPRGGRRLRGPPAVLSTPHPPRSPEAGPAPTGEAPTGEAPAAKVGGLPGCEARDFLEAFSRPPAPDARELAAPSADAGRGLQPGRSGAGSGAGSRAGGGGASRAPPVARPGPAARSPRRLPSRGGAFRAGATWPWRAGGSALPSAAG